MLSLSRSGVYDAIERGDLQAIRFGSKYVLPTAPLRKLLLIEDSRRSPPPPDEPPKGGPATARGRGSQASRDSQHPGGIARRSS